MPNATKEIKIAKIISAAEELIDEKGVFDFSFKGPCFLNRMNLLPLA